MRAAVFYGPKDVRLEEVADPTPGENDVVLEVAACGICGSDLEYYTGASPLGTPDGKGPLVLGHEMAGTIAAVGGGVTHLKEGDRVAVNPNQATHSSDFARAGYANFDTSTVLGTSINGGLARYVRLRADTAHVISDAISDAQGAFAETLASSVNSVEMADVGLGDFVVIYGPGPVGLAQVQLAKLRGATVLLVGTRDYRLDVGRSLGADLVANVKDSASPHHVDDLTTFIRDQNRGRLADRAILATTELSVNQQALEITGEGSTIVYMGLAGPDDAVSLPLLSSLVAAKTIRFSWLYPNQWPRTIGLLEAGLISTDAIITHSKPLDEVTDAIGLIESRSDDVLKVVLTP